ncbi:transposase [Corynebacterium bovis]|uniref:RNA-guided endonuclease InsQ/TnpB family protein n=1 Tax=Corynebacterium bovis TaxID=36808 RepID=UPI000F64AFD8|nr:RNA-guided endonuclease TnpB family protein [Corynebacterium bovis]RRO97067.1 transposase [Corynebacterium bovis]
MSNVKRRQTFRAYPTGQQAKELSRLFGCTRVVRNHFITIMQQAHRQGDTLSLSTAEKVATTTLKRTEGYGFLNEVSAVALQQAARNTTRSFREFFRACSGSRSRVGFPRYASKRNRQTASFTKAANFRIRHPQGCRWGFIRLPKITGELKFRACRDLDWSSVGTVTVTRSPSGVYEVSVTHDVEPVILPETVTACGVDLGLTSLAAVVSSSGHRHLVDNPRFYRSAKRKLASVQRSLSRKTKGSANRKKAAARVAKIGRKVACQRKDHLDKLSRHLVNDNQVIGIEDLSVAALSRCLRLSTSVYDAGWAMFRDMLTYKAADAGRTLVVVDRFYPSSQTCSVCGRRDGKKSLNVRSWVCAGCHSPLDRDFNAATNLMLYASEAAGHADSLNACGGSVRLRLAGAVSREAGTHRSGRETGAVGIPAL